MQIINPTSGGAPAAPLMKTGTSNNKWTVFNGVSSISAVINTTLNQMRAFKVYIPSACTLTPNCVVATGLASAHVNCAFYNADATTGLPGTKAYDFGQFDISTTGQKTGTPVAVAAGEYWCVWSGDLAQTGHMNFAVLTTTPDNQLFNTIGPYTGLDATPTYTNPLPATSTASFTQRTASISTPIFFNVS